ncbi:MAG: hypothetical protein IJ950_01495 [Helicobacter sp.]|nr:hypothetical protein [Helicobacter sp.]
MNYEETKGYLTRYIKARIPIITINTLEKDRIIRMLTEISNESNFNFNIFQMSQGITDLKTNTIISEDKTIMSALDFISNDIKYKENCNYTASFVEMSGLWHRLYALHFSNKVNVCRSFGRALYAPTRFALLFGLVWLFWCIYCVECR